ncbi:MAG: hypothetical protein HQL32_12430, partial [Planctomycetes bacterium]|nr:hypothetical protein [Planctomycetota bacterium]
MSMKTHLISCLLILTFGLQLQSASFTVNEVTGDVSYRAYKSFKKVPVKKGDELQEKGKLALKNGAFLKILTPMGDVLE